MAGRDRRRDRPRRGVIEVENRIDPRTQAASLSSLGPFTYKVKQGDRKRNKSKAVDGVESGSEFGLSSAPSGAEESGDETLTEENQIVSDSDQLQQQHRQNKNIIEEDWEGDDEKSDTIKQDKGKGRIEDPDQSPTPRRFIPVTLPIKRPHRIQPQLQYLPQVPVFIPHQAQIVYVDPNRNQPVQYTQKAPSEHSEHSESAPEQGLHDYDLIRISREKQAEADAIMKNIGDVFDVQEWDPELPTVPDPDASPERLTVKPEPLTYTTVGSLVKPSDARQFTAPNRIQREGRAGLEAAGRRPMLNTTNPRGQEFFSARNVPQYSGGQSYQNPVTQNFVPEQSPIGKYQSAQYARRGPVQDQSSAAIYASPGQATGQNFARDQISGVGYGQQFGMRNFGHEQAARQTQETPFAGQNTTSSAANSHYSNNPNHSATGQASRQSFSQEHRFTGQNTAGPAMNLQYSDVPHHIPTVQASRQSFSQEHHLTGQYTGSPATTLHNSDILYSTASTGQASRQSFPEERPFPGQNTASSARDLPDSDTPHSSATERSMTPLNELETSVLTFLGAPLPPISSRQENIHPNTGKPVPQPLSPIQEVLLAQLQQIKPVERSGNIQRQPIGTSAASSEATTVRPTIAMNHDMFMSSSSTNSAARLQDAKMSTVQRLAQFPNPDQERAKAMLADLAASKMRGGGNDDYGAFGQHSKVSGMSMPYDTDHDSHGDNEVEVDGYYRRVDAGTELNHNFRFPNPGGNSIQQQHSSNSGSTIRPAGFPRKTPQGYPQPLTAGPPGLRQNTAPSSNKALNSMQEMLANNNRRTAGPPNQQYSLPNHSAQLVPAQDPYAAGPPSQQYSLPLHSAQLVPAQDPYASRPADARLSKTNDAAQYPWGNLDKQPRDFIQGALPRVRETLALEYARDTYYPGGMDTNTYRSFVTTLPKDEARRHYPRGMDEATEKWFDEESKWQQQPQSDLGALIDGSVPFNQWQRGTNINAPPSDAWFRSGNGLKNNATPGGPGIIGQPRETTESNQAVDDRSLSLDEIKSMPHSKATGILLGGVITSLSQYRDNSPENIAKLKAKGIVDVTGDPSGDNSLFDSEFHQKGKEIDRDPKHRASFQGSGDQQKYGGGSSYYK